MPIASRMPAPEPASTMPSRSVYGQLEGVGVVIAVQDFDFMGGLARHWPPGEAIVRGLEPRVSRRGRRSSYSQLRAVPACRKAFCVADADAAHHGSACRCCAKRNKPYNRRADQSDPPAALQRPTRCWAMCRSPNPVR